MSPHLEADDGERSPRPGPTNAARWSASDVAWAARDAGWPAVQWRQQTIEGEAAWRAALKSATAEELAALRGQLALRKKRATDPMTTKSGMNRITRRTTTRVNGKTMETLTEDLAPPRVQLIRVPKSEPAEWERERDELRAKVARLEADVRRLASAPSALPLPSPRVAISTTSYRCWRAIAGLISASSGPVRIVRLDFDAIDREAGHRRTPPETRRLVLEDMAKEAREDREFWLAHPDLRELRFDESAAATLMPVSQSLATQPRSAPAAVARVLAPIGFRL
jgi:hypothetical protein